MSDTIPAEARALACFALDKAVKAGRDPNLGICRTAAALCSGEDVPRKILAVAQQRTMALKDTDNIAWWCVGGNSVQAWLAESDPPIVEAKLAAPRVVTDLFSELNTVDREAIGALQALADTEYARALKRVGMAMTASTRDPKLKARMAAARPEDAVALMPHTAALPEAIAARIRTALADYDEQARNLIGRYQTAAIRAIARAFGVPFDELNNRLQAEARSHTARAVDYLRAALTATIGRRLRSPDGTIDDGPLGDPNSVPGGLVIDALAIAGGAVGEEIGPDDEVFPLPPRTVDDTHIGSDGRPSRGVLGTGHLAQDAIDDAIEYEGPRLIEGIEDLLRDVAEDRSERWIYVTEWQHRSDVPFEPHRRLDGSTWTTASEYRDVTRRAPEDVAAYPAGNAQWFRRDHRHCRCLFHISAQLISNDGTVIEVV